MEIIGEMINETDNEDVPPVYDLLCKMDGVRIGTTIVEMYPRTDRNIEVDLYLRTDLPIKTALKEILERLERLEEKGFSISIVQEFGLTCSRSVGEDQLDEVLDLAISAVSGGVFL